MRPDGRHLRTDTTTRERPEWERRGFGARYPRAEAEHWAGVLETAGDPPPPRLAARLSDACDRAERLWLEYAASGPDAEEPIRDAP